MIRLLTFTREKRNTSVCLFLDISESPRSHGMGSPSTSSILARLLGEEEGCWLDDAFCEPWRGVLTSSVFRLSVPRRVTVCTSLSSRTLPFGTIFLGLEERDIVGNCQQVRTNWNVLGMSPYGRTLKDQPNSAGACLTSSIWSDFFFSHFGWLSTRNTNEERKMKIFD